MKSHANIVYKASLKSAIGQVGKLRRLRTVFASNESVVLSYCLSYCSFSL